MIQYDRILIGRQAEELGFVRDTYEKVCRLSDVLDFIAKDDLLSTSLALKGGTAINLTIFNLPRLSVDIDLDYSELVSRYQMLAKRKLISERIKKYMMGGGYEISEKSKKYHALESLVFNYQNAAGTKDNLKIEINYMLRCHVLPTERRKFTLPWQNSENTILCVAPLEIFASKIVALINRAAPRDLFDLTMMIHENLFDKSKQELLRKCIVFYSAIGSENTPVSFSFDRFMEISQNKIKTDLLPVLRNGKYFDVKKSQQECLCYLKGLLCPTKDELAFWEAFRDKRYCPELVFSDQDIVTRIKQHPMALWKCSEHNLIEDNNNKEIN